MTAKPDDKAGHGRTETRTATVWYEIGWLCETHGWPGMKAVGKVERMRETTANTTPERLTDVARSHWGVENSLHWRLMSE